MDATAGDFGAMYNLCTSTVHCREINVFISGTAGVYIGAKDPTELNECQHKIAMQKSQWKLL